MNTKIVTIALLLFTVIAAGCVPQETQLEPTNNQQDPPSLSMGTYTEPSSDTLAQEVATQQFKSEEAFLAFIKSHRSGDGYYGGLAMRSLGGDVAVMDMAVEESAASAPMAKMAGDLDYSETNNQVAGIDEADILKTDGNYIYTVTDNTLFVIEAYPGEDAQVVSTVSFDSNRPTGMFVFGNTLAIFGNLYELDFFDELDMRPRNGMTFFTLYDISDKENLVVEKEYKFEGNYFNARMMGDDVYFVVKTYPDYRIPEPMPLIMEDNIARSMPVNDIFFFDIPYRNPEFVTVHAIDLATEQVNSKSVAVENGQNMYMSENNIYLTYTEWINEWELEQEIMIELLAPFVTESDKALIEKIKLTDDEVLSLQEKQQKIRNIYFSYQNYLSNEEQEELRDEADRLLELKLKEFEHFEYTIINRISVDNGKISVEANGKVPGAIVNQFSMDEFEGVFRIATTVNQRWSRFGKERTESINNIFTLDADLEMLDSLTGMAEGERIYSTRFMGEKLYMVTFRQIDPFFVIDLSDPTDIQELGELKIPGFSRYLHPYDETTIIGVGQDATETGRVQGLKISLFDVSDVTSPQEVASFITDEKYAQSTALYEHKAFLFSKEKNLLVIPAYSYQYQMRNPIGYNGAFVFDISKDEIELRGLIDHSDGRGNSRYWYQPMVERSLYIEDLLYTKSPNLLRVNALEDLESVKDVELKVKSSSTIEIY